MSEFVPALELPEKDHYSYVTKSVMRLFKEGRLDNVQDIYIEPEYGYVANLIYVNEQSRITYGNDLGLNTATAADLAKDKGHTKSLLKTLNVACPDGATFLLPSWQKTIADRRKQRGNSSMRTIDKAVDYIEQNFGYPVYIKPVDGSKGSGIHKIYDDNELRTIVDEYESKKVRVALIEEPINLPDYRIVMLDNNLISMYRRDPLRVIGDGTHSIGELIQLLQARFDEEKRDTQLDMIDRRIITHLGRQSLRLADIVPPDMTVTLADISNLSTGGNAEDVTDVVHPYWIAKAKYIARCFNLRLCGIDLACADITDPQAEYSVLELNAAPGLDHYAMSGDAQKDVVDDLYTKVLNALPNSV